MLDTSVTRLPCLSAMVPVSDCVSLCVCVCSGEQRFNQEGTTDGSETTSNLNQKLYYHRLGTDQSQDVLCVQFTDHPKWRM